MDTEACNYDAAAMLNYARPIRPRLYYPTPERGSARGQTAPEPRLLYTDGDGVCDVDEIPGCLVEEASI